MIADTHNFNFMQGTVRMGGFGNIWQAAMDGGRLEIFK